MSLRCCLADAADRSGADKQAIEIAARLGKAMAWTMRDVTPTACRDLHPTLRLPLAALAFPLLRRRPRPELDAFIDAVYAMVHADGQVSLFEYCLGRLLHVQVREALDPSRYARFGRRKLDASAQRDRDAAGGGRAGRPCDAATRQRAYLAGLQRVLPR